MGRHVHTRVFERQMVQHARHPLDYAVVEVSVLHLRRLDVLQRPLYGGLVSRAALPSFQVNSMTHASFRVEFNDARKYVYLCVRMHITHTVTRTRTYTHVNA